MTDPYDDALLYDLEYADHREDVAFYVERARAARGTVLELGCGTGRLTLPIARAGVRVVGVDRSAAMLAELERKLALEPPEVRELVSWSQGDYRGSDAGGPYATVLWPFNALHHCADEAELGAMFERIAAWVPPAGRLALDAYLPDPELYRRDPAGRYEQRTFLHPTTGETLESWEEGWWDGEHTVHHVVYVYRRPGGSEHRTHLQLRMFSLEQLRSLLAGAGWRILREWKDFRGTLLGPDALKWVAVAERR